MITSVEINFGRKLKVWQLKISNQSKYWEIFIIKFFIMDVFCFDHDVHSGRKLDVSHETSYLRETAIDIWFLKMITNGSPMSKKLERWTINLVSISCGLFRVDWTCFVFQMVFHTVSLVSDMFSYPNSLLRADDIRLVGTTCCESVGLINLVTRW